MLGSFIHFFCRRLIFFQNKLFKKIISRTLSECLTLWIRIRTGVMSVMIWVQTACKGYQKRQRKKLERPLRIQNQILEIIHTVPNIYHSINEYVARWHSSQYPGSLLLFHVYNLLKSWLIKKFSAGSNLIFLEQKPAHEKKAMAVLFLAITQSNSLHPNKTHAEMRQWNVKKKN